MTIRVCAAVLILIALPALVSAQSIFEPRSWKRGMGRSGAPERLFAGPYLDGDANGLSARTYDISLDDRRFLMIKDPDTRAAAGPSLIVVEHWTEELKKLAK